MILHGTDGSSFYAFWFFYFFFNLQYLCSSTIFNRHINHLPLFDLKILGLYELTINIAYSFLSFLNRNDWDMKSCDSKYSWIVIILSYTADFYKLFTTISDDEYHSWSLYSFLYEAFGFEHLWECQRNTRKVQKLMIRKPIHE